jgi:hypothetical protein
MIRRIAFLFKNTRIINEFDQYSLKDITNKRIKYLMKINNSDLLFKNAMSIM